MPEGDTLFRTAAALRPHLVGRQVVAAKARLPGPDVRRVVGTRIEAVESRGKQLLIRFDGGLELRTHLGMHGSWHRYAPGERWQRPAARARLVLEVPGAVAVCFDAPTVELFAARAEPIHPVLAAQGPDLLDPAWDDACLAEAVRRLGAPERAPLTIAEALLDQTAVAGIGNVYKNEALFLEHVDPFAPAGELGQDTLRRLVVRARELLLANVGGGARTTLTSPAGGAMARGGRLSRHWVYGRAGRPCRRCGTLLLDRRHGRLNRRTIWCPRCQTASLSS